MYEYHIMSTQRISLLNGLYYKFLYKDDVWFYGLYGPCLIKLRLKNRCKDIEKYLKDLDIYCDGKEYGKKNEEGVKEFHNNFEDYVRVLHSMSVLIIKNEQPDIVSKLVHLLCNMKGYNHDEESIYIMKHALGQAQIHGAIIGLDKLGVT